jgi:hypothetical protein
MGYVFVFLINFQIEVISCLNGKPVAAFIFYVAGMTSYPNQLRVELPMQRNVPPP